MISRPVLAHVLLMALAAPLALQAAQLPHPDHFEFNATLDAAFRSQSAARHVNLRFEYPGAGGATLAAWRLQALDAQGKALRSWVGLSPIHEGHARAEIEWDARDRQAKRVGDGFYRLRLRAVPAVEVAADSQRSLSERVNRSFALAEEEKIEQLLDVMVGEVPPPVMPVFDGLTRLEDSSKSTAATGGLPYTIYYGNLHSQTNHSDGGTPVGSCTGSAAPQGGQFGPADAFAMMDVQAGGDFLLASEHNHMYDGSNGTNTAATPESANDLFNSGLAAAANYTAAQPNFLALYGNEWGVISNGGHLNIVNPDALPSWEYNASGQLIGSVPTVKSDYAHLYGVMRQRGWVGQFNHPSSSQFAIGGAGMAYHVDGAEVMVATEIMNTSAFSTNTTETEVGRSTFTGAWNVLLERGYKVAPTTNQDNHCANWGLSFRNRTGVLIGSALTFNSSSFIDALKARRTFATEDKAAQLVLLANGAVMGQTISNNTALSLDALYASSNGGSAARVQFFEGVPGRNGVVTQLFEGAGSFNHTPTEGAHFYYAVVTEADGDRLWSAPIWVNQGGGLPDTTPPTVSASVFGSSGTITLSAEAADNVGVSTVEFFVDGVSKGIDSSAPYAINLDSTTLTDGSHSLTATAVDAAANSTTSTPVNFNVDNSSIDSIAPTTSITAPAAGSTLNGVVLVSASAFDNIAVTNVEFYLNGALQGSDATAPYEWNWNTTTALNGSHTLQSRAYDAALNVGTSSVISVSINNGGLAGDADVSGWRISQANSTNNFTLPAGTVIPAGGYLVVARSASRAAFEAYWSRSLGSNVVFIDSAGAMPVINGDENYSLFDASASLSDGPTPSMPASAARTVQRSTPCSASWATLVESSASAGSGAGAGCGAGVKINEFSDASGTGNYIYEFVELYNDAAAVADTEAPSTAITAPANATTISGTTLVTANASDNIGVTDVEFYLDGVLQSTDTSAPYEWSWNTTTTANGSHTLSVKAMDAAGNVGTSAAVSTTVSNDTTPPITSITAPANGASVSGSTLVSASASDNVGVTQVRFYLNGVLQHTDSSAPYEWSWDTTAAVNGSHTLSADALDAAGNVGISAGVSALVSNDTTPPTVSITAPANGATVSGSILVTADASDNVSVTHVEFYLDGVLQATDSSAPYQWTWNTVSSSNGSHDLSSRAYDANNNSTISNVINVTVSNGSSIAGYRLAQSNATLSYLLPSGSSITTGGYVVIGRNASQAQFEAFWGVTLAANVVYINSSDSMPQINGSETYTLYNSSNTVLDGATVAMSSGAGESLQRKNACGSARKASSWNRRAASEATPGSGAPASCGKGLYISEFSDALGTTNYVFEFLELHKDN